MDQWAGQIAGLRVLVTGAGGFIGGRVTQRLAAAGAKVIPVLHRAPPQDALPALVPAGAEWRVADLTRADLDALLDQTDPQAIVHCAGLTRAPETEAGRAALFAANLTATDRLLQAATRRSSPPRLVLLSSAAIYAPMHEGQAAITEDHPLRPVAAYGVSKAAATLLALAEAARHNLDLALAVPFNVIGAGQPGTMVPQVFINRLRQTPAGFALPSAEVIRDWIDVEDVTEALIALACPAGPRGLFNMATGTGISLREIALRLCKIGGWTPAPVATGPAAQGVTRSVGDPGRLRAALGWHARRELNDSLLEMIGAPPQSAGSG